MNRRHLLVVAAAAVTAGCTPTPELDPTFEYADAELPDHYLEASPNPMGGMGGGPPGFDAAIDHDNTPDDNPVTNAGATLGRVLFYDADLSANGTVSCSSCHVAEHGFADDAVLSEGFEGGETGRHSMGLANARFYSGGQFFWDQRAETLEDQVLMPFQDPVEMGMTLPEVVQVVEADRRYDDLFLAAFGDETVTSDRISRALAQFVRSMVSTTSPYDEGRAQVDAIMDPFPNFTDTENTGKELFYAPPPMGGLGCAHCHATDAQIAYRAISNGLDAEVTDEGYGEVTQQTLDMGTFKVPSLRNIAVRAPYMHDGRFASLDDVLDHYSNDIEYHATLPPFFTSGTGTSRPLHLTQPEREALLAFLNTLTDDEMLQDPKFSDPGW